MKSYSAENLFLMTAKKKVTSTSKSKVAKTKSPAEKVVAKKATKAVQAKAKPVTKKVAAKSKPSVSRATKATKEPATKSPTKTKTTPSKNSKTKAKSGVKKVPAKKAPAKAKESNTISKVKEILSKTIAKPEKDDSKAESNSFSFDDALGFLKLKKKTKSKKQAEEKGSGSNVGKVEKEKEKKQTKVKKLTTASIDDILGFGAPVVGVKRPVRDETKVPKQWMPYYQALMALRTALKGSLGERSSETIGASARESGELSINSSDAGTETFDRDLALSMVANDQEALEEIEDAIDRIFNGTYGVCMETQKPINKNRLKAVPFTRFSVEGQNQFERGKIKERDFGSGSFATLADSTMGEEE